MPIFDIWSYVTGNAGAGKSSCIVTRIGSLESGELSLSGNGVDVSHKIYPSVIVQDKYYYHISKEGRFGKYQITEDNIATIKEIPFVTLKDRRYTHAWLDDKMLLLVGSNGASDQILWAKVDTEKMMVIKEGALNLPAPPTGQVYNTSGIVAYRKADNRLLYFFKYNNQGKNGTEPAPEFYAAFINPDDMTTIKTVTEKRAEQMAATAYGELRQQKSFFDENGDYYLACNSVLPDEGTTTAQHGALLRIKRGAYEFDQSYNAYSEERGKIITVSYLNNGKVLMFMQDPMHTTGNTLWNSAKNPYVFYWIIVDLKTKKIEELKSIPFSSGNFSQLSIVEGDKAYIGVNPEIEKSAVFIYDIPTGKISQGITLTKGFYIDRIVRVND